MRRGVTGICLGWCGFEPFYSYIGKPDIYGNLLHSTQINLLDSLATSASLVMGEGNEQTPLALIQNTPKINFQNHSPSFDEEQSVIVTMDKCLYSPLLTSVHWHKKCI
jgi:F420-0:gamma-glutamyl ligase